MPASVTTPSDELPSPSTRPTSSRKRWVIGILVLLGIIAVLVGIKAAQIGAMIQAGASFVPPPESVTSAKAETIEWQASRRAVGTVLAVRGVSLGAELSGIVRDIGFENGARVKKGQVLVQLDTSSEAAQLTGAEADAELARLTRARVQTLHAQGAKPQADLESAQARVVQAEAIVTNLRALIAKKVIRAPFDGRIGIRQVELGQVISPGSPIASLHSMDPIHVEFLLPQQALAEVKPGQKVRIHVDVFPRNTWEGELTTINPEVEISSRNVRMRATVPNTDGRLLPGMFANVDVLSEDTSQVVAIPTTAVLFAPYGDSVFVLEEKKDAAGNPSLVAQQRFARLGERRGDFVAVASGLKPGETVVSNGVFKLRNGAAVVVNNALAPQAEASPQPVAP
ncbi:efflux RND transporter periplasmic adaptor subunit [Stigmatella sp. ncwal1]|uniref:Efflux RND transporter periplasmic adaptor subunit n=1 Tax=Stigmatella ashevillensis TaxID=2995309 RepID=A0ABT5DHC4_9BACT|nr:efflux RND transporter periplasmic adaptor subunit [Stigmatella ashevillena]MDC0712513.1 efflux RND transporter periplasmic adaptor subunit [Stigmatella ashevillena]